MKFPLKQVNIIKNFLVALRCRWATLPRFLADHRIPNRSATQIAVPKQRQVGYRRRDVFGETSLEKNNNRFRLLW
ncbi:MAG: hypothetical protein LBE12_11200 [Planctomycetaceae bacterium]|jgi:hypothetical protein|nr:hypothetical protein [Planctomycetaceae bacterium]